jgi:acyl carrier protein
VKLVDLIRQVFQLADDVELQEGWGPGEVPGWDSLGHLSLISSLESTYGISMRMNEVMRIGSVADIRELLASKGVSND